MNKKLPNRDQSESLRHKVEHEVFEEGQVIEREDLPPRSRVHQQKRKKNKWKIKYPIIRLLVLFFILLPITIFSIYSTIAERKGSISETIGESTDGFEIIDIEKPDSQKINNEEMEEDRPEFNYEVTEKENNEKDSNSKSDESTSTTSVESLIEEAENEQGPKSHEPTSTISIESLIEKDENKQDPQSIIYHTVQPNETIYRISMKYYKSKAGIDTIKSVNNLNGNEIRIGQVLTIPLTK